MAHCRCGWPVYEAEDEYGDPVLECRKCGLTYEDPVREEQYVHREVEAAVARRRRRPRATLTVGVSR